MKKLITLLVLVIFVTSPIIAQTKEEKKAAKAENSLKEYEAMKELVNSKSLMFVADWTTTQKGRRVDLMSNPNFIKIDNKNADIFLPFFGVSQIAAYGAGGGIEFKGEVENYNVKFDDKKQKATVKFKGKNDKSENFDFTIQIFGGGSTSVNVNSNHRNNARYNGKTTILEKEIKDE